MSGIMKYSAFFVISDLVKQKNMEQNNMEQNNMEQNNMKQNNMEQNNMKQNNMKQNNMKQNNMNSYVLNNIIRILFFLIIFYIILYIWAFFILIKYFSELNMFSKVTGLMGIFLGFPFITIVAVYGGSDKLKIIENYNKTNVKLISK